MPVAKQYYIVWWKGRPYYIRLAIGPRYGTRLQLFAVDAYNPHVAEYVSRHFNDCPYARLRGEEFKRFVALFGIHPGAYCMKMIMRGKTFPKKPKGITRELIQALTASREVTPEELRQLLTR